MLQKESASDLPCGEKQYIMGYSVKQVVAAI
jgi:hypothetical protein